MLVYRVPAQVYGPWLFSLSIGGIASMQNLLDASNVMSTNLPSLWPEIEPVRFI